MSQLEIKYKKIEELKGYDRNSRTHSYEQVSQIANSINTFGFTNPLLIDDDGVIIAGHGRIEAAKKVGIKEVPTITISGLNDDEKKALVIADNQLALNAGWDFDMLKLEIEELQENGFNLDVMGFDDDELDAILEGVEPEEEKSADGKVEVEKITLEYLKEDFKEVSMLSERLCDELGVHNNSELFRFLIENYIGLNRMD